MVDAERFIMLIKRDKFDYTDWQKDLLMGDSVDSLFGKAQSAWKRENNF